MCVVGATVSVAPTKSPTVPYLIIVIADLIRNFG